MSQEAFYSILFPSYTQILAARTEMPEFFVDLNLDQIIDAIVAKKDEYNLKPFFYTFPTSPEIVQYRQQIMHDLENKTIFGYFKMFEDGMRAVRTQLQQIEKIHYRYHKERLFLDVAVLYCETLLALANHLSRSTLTSEGLLAFRNYLTNYTQSTYFTFLISEAKALIHNLSDITYSLHIKDLRVRVIEYQPADDYGLEVQKTFEKFRQGEVNDYKSAPARPWELNHVEAKILEGLAYLYPELFNRLLDFYEKNIHFQDEIITTFDREIQFYIAFLEFIEPIKHNGLQFCYPSVSTENKEESIHEGFDIALAHKYIHEKSPIVTNDFYIQGNERILVVTGPNQGGKTTFARMVGQMHYLAGIGCPVAASKAQLFLCDNIFTHFERKESVQNLRGKLEDDLVRLRSILEHCTTNSLVILNEILTSTTLNDSIFLSKKIMEKLIYLDVLGVWVTFIDELASYSEQTVSMSATVFPENPALRTFKIERMPANGLAYAQAIAEKYQLSYHALKNRISAKR